MTPTVESLWNEFATKLGRFIRARVADPATAEDLLQDVFVKLQGQLGQIQDSETLQSWLYLVARNAVIDHYRTRKKTSEVPESLPSRPPEHDPEVEELRAVFHRLILNLPKSYRDALVLTEFEGVSQKQLSQRLGISLSGAKSRVQRGRELLREMLLEYCHREFSSAIGCQPCPKGLLPPVQEGPPRTRRERLTRSGKPRK